MLASAPLEDAMAASRSSIHQETGHVLGKLSQSSRSVEESVHHTDRLGLIKFIRLRSSWSSVHASLWVNHRKWILINGPTMRALRVDETSLLATC